MTKHVICVKNRWALLAERGTILIVPSRLYSYKTRNVCSGFRGTVLLCESENPSVFTPLYHNAICQFLPLLGETLLTPTPPHLFLHPSPPATTPSTPFIYPFYFPSFLPFMSDLYWFYYGSVTHPARVALSSHHVRAGLWLRDPQANGMVQRGFLVTEPPLHIVVLYPEMTNRPKTSQNPLYWHFYYWGFQQKLR